MSAEPRKEPHSYVVTVYDKLTDGEVEIPVVAQDWGEALERALMSWRQQRDLARFRNAQLFYEDDPTRRPSPELDFGYLWTDREAGPGIPSPRYRVSWVVDTGDLYALSLVGDDHVLLLGNVYPRNRINQLMKGWAALEQPSLDWVRERLRGVRPAP